MKPRPGKERKKKKKKIASQSPKTVVMRHAFSQYPHQQPTPSLASLYLPYHRFSIIMSQYSCPELIGKWKTYTILQFWSTLCGLLHLTLLCITHTLHFHQHIKTVDLLTHQRGRYKNIHLPHGSVKHGSKCNICRKQGKQVPFIHTVVCSSYKANILFWFVKGRNTFPLLCPL